jgi:hypothetical protein
MSPHTHAQPAAFAPGARHIRSYGEFPYVQAAKTGAVDHDANLASTIPRLPSVAVPNKPPVIFCQCSEIHKCALVDTGKFGTRSQKPASRVYRVRVRS